MTSNEKSVASRLRWARDFLVLVFAVCHSLKLLASILPESYRPDPWPLGLSHAYEVLTGSRQNWNMFETIPSHHRYGASIVITTNDGGTRYLGPLLPGFQSYPEPENARVFNLFERMLGGDMGDGVRDAYLLDMDRALWDEHHISPGEKWSLEVTEDFTRHLAHIRRDGRLFERRAQRFSLTPR